MSDWTLAIAHHQDEARIGRRIRLSRGDSLLLGRGGAALGADALLDARISRRHARLTVDGGGLQVEDLGSRNGTFLDGERVRAGRVQEGVVLSLGGVLLQAWPSVEPPGPPLPPLVGESPAMEALRQDLRRMAESEEPLLLVGEDGAGRSVAARALHLLACPSKPFVVLPIAQVPEERAAHALHGHAADPAPEGALLRAEGGVLLLPRLDGAAPGLQRELLRFLRDGRVRPRQGPDRPLELRLVATAARPSARGSRPGDLLPELAAAFGDRVLEVPPLRARREDVLPLARRLVTRHAGRAARFDRLLALLLALHPWPGNAAELDAVLRRIVAEQPDEEVLQSPPWAAEVFGPRALQAGSTFDPSQGGLSGGPP